MDTLLTFLERLNRKMRAPFGKSFREDFFRFNELAFRVLDITLVDLPKKIYDPEDADEDGYIDITRNVANSLNDKNTEYVSQILEPAIETIKWCIEKYGHRAADECVQSQSIDMMLNNIRVLLDLIDGPEAH